MRCKHTFTWKRKMKWINLLTFSSCKSAAKTSNTEPSSPVWISENLHVEYDTIDTKLQSNVIRIQMNWSSFVYIRSIVSISHLKVYLLHCVGELCTGQCCMCMCMVSLSVKRFVMVKWLRPLETKTANRSWTKIVSGKWMRNTAQ